MENKGKENLKDFKKSPFFLEIIFSRISYDNKCPAESSQKNIPKLEYGIYSLSDNFKPSRR